MSQPKIGIVILAAGASRRMGKAKQLLPFEGESLIRRICHTALETGCHPVVVVLGARNEQIRPELMELPVDIAINKEWETGMGTSVRTGIEHLLQLQPALDAALFLLVDQPYVTTNLLLSIIEKYRKTDHSLVVSDYGDTLGVPALFDKNLFAGLQQIEGDKGARALIKRYRNQLTTVSFPGGSIDWDTPEDITGG